MNVIVYMGNAEAREIIRYREFYYRNSTLNQKKKVTLDTKFNALITSYETAVIDSNILKKINWECMVVDEAHRLKNNESKFFKVSQTIKTKYKVLLTGTPL